MAAKRALCCLLLVSVASGLLPYQDPSQPIEARITDLVSRMSLEEKVNQTLNDYFAGAFGPTIPSDPAGQAAIASEGMRYLFKFCTADLASCIQTRNHFQTLAKDRSRLGIPVSFSEETLHGSLFAPQYPMPVNLGCTWNDSLVEQVFQETAWQASAVGINVGLSPVVNMFPDARFGRLQEGFSEDPYLTSRMGVASVLGLQGHVFDPEAPLGDQSKLAAVVKHYLAYGLAQQGGIDGGPAILDEQTLRERYLPPWRALASRGMLRGVMASQSAVNHVPMHCHKRLITEVLRGELNASLAFVHSDGGCVISCIHSVYHLAESEGGAAALALGAGVDMDFAGCSYSQLGAEVTAGRVPVAELDRAVSNVLRIKFATGLFDRAANVSVRSSEELDSPGFRATARQAAEQSVVMLINRRDQTGPALPLAWGGLKSVLLAGPLIDDYASQNGGYSHAGAPTTTIRAAAVAAAAAHGFRLTTLLGTSNGTSGNGEVAGADQAAIAAAEAAAESVDVAVLVLGDDLSTCAEMGDRASLGLLGGQQQLLQRVAAVAKKTVVVLIGGRPLTFETGQCVAAPKSAPAPAVGFPWDPSGSVGAACSVPSLLANVSALLMAWRPGAEGGPAVLRLLGGEANPSGHLSVAWPRSVGGIGAQAPYLQQLALHYRETYQEEPSNPLFRFGYGLSYTNFSLGPPAVLSLDGAPVVHPVGANDTVVIAANLSSVSGPAGATVVQLYFQQATAPVIRYVQQLVGYKRVSLEPWEHQTVLLELRVADMAYWDNKEAGHLPGPPGWALGVPGVPSTFNLMVGLSAAECTGTYSTKQQNGGCDLQHTQLQVMP